MKLVPRQICLKNQNELLKQISKSGNMQNKKKMCSFHDTNLSQLSNRIEAICLETRLSHNIISELLTPGNASGLH